MLFLLSSHPARLLSVFICIHHCKKTITQAQTVTCIEETRCLTPPARSPADISDGTLRQCQRASCVSLLVPTLWNYTITANFKHSHASALFISSKILCEKFIQLDSTVLFWCRFWLETYYCKCRQYSLKRLVGGGMCLNMISYTIIHTKSKISILAIKMKFWFWFINLM